MPLDAHGCPACPHPAIGPAIQGSPDVNVNRRPALRVDDPGIHAACCGTNTWTATKGSRYTFIVRRLSAKLRVAFQDADGEPSSGRAWRASCDTGAVENGALDGAGLLEIPILVTTRHVTVTLATTHTDPEQIFQLLIGHLDPMTQNTGFVARLQNLGYLRSDFDDDEAELRSAIEELQCDAGLPVSGWPDSATRIRLVDLHGV